MMNKILILSLLLGYLVYSQDNNFDIEYNKIWNEQVRLIQKFYDLINQKSSPTVKDYFDIFGSTNEWELDFILKEYAKVNFTNKDSIPYDRKIYSSPEKFNSLVFKKIRENKDKIYPPEFDNPKQNIFISLATLEMKRDDPDKKSYEKKIEVILRTNKSTFKSIFFILFGIPDSMPYKPSIADIRLQNNSSFLQLLFDND